jgi:SAM-dependent methyltransferase
MQPKPTPAQVYERYLVPAIFAPCARVLLEAVEPRPGERALDVACGSGVVARQVAALVGAGGRVIGVDLRPGMIEVARSLPAPAGASIAWHEGDALALDLPDGSFDLVTCQQGLQFFADRVAALREMRRVLVPGGRVGVAVWLGLDRLDLFRALAEGEVRHLASLGVTYEDAAAPFTLGDPEEVRALLSAAGFADVSVEERSFEARFSEPERFVSNVDFAYAAVIPQFAEDPAAFEAFAETVQREMHDVIEGHRQGDELVIQLHLNLATATA